MCSARPKALHRLGGYPLLYHVYRAAAALEPQAIYIVYGYAGEQLRAEVALPPQVHWVLQEQQQGTGHAAAVALDRITAGPVLILNGDVPLLQTATLHRLVSAQPQDGLSILSTRLDTPYGYGRILRDAQGRVQGAVEQADATPEQLGTSEGYAGAMVADAEPLRGWLGRVDNHNRQNEYYLVDVIALAIADHREVCVASVEHTEAGGVNTLADLATLERLLQRRQATALLEAGVTLMDPDRFDLRGELHTGSDVIIDINTLFEGEVHIGNNVHIGAGCIIRDSVLGDGTRVLPNSYIAGAQIGQHCKLGPFCRIRPGTQLHANVRIGNFVELKRADIGAATNINHLSYIGDAKVGTDANLGCGTVTCNYDGRDKHRTVIEDRVHIGSHVQLVAPIHVGSNATVAAGSTLTEDVEAGTLAIARSRQQTIRGWHRPGSGGKA